jgi:hypothetical protein
VNQCPREFVERPASAEIVLRGLVQPERCPVVSLGLIVSSLQAAEVTEFVVRECLPDRVVIGRAQPQCPGQMQAAGALTAQQGVRAAEQPVRVCQAELVTGPAGGG